MDKIEYSNKKRKYLASKKKEIEKLYSNVKKIISSCRTKTVGYEENKIAFEYVNSLFPNCNVKDVSVYKAPKSLLDKRGFSHADGFYLPDLKVILFSNNRNLRKRKRKEGKVPDEVVLIHELLHYCYYEQGMQSFTTEIIEEFAYGWSVPYLKKIGYSDEKIIEEYFYPAMSGIVYKECLKEVLLQNNISPKEYNNFTRKKKVRICNKYNKIIENLMDEKVFKKGKDLIDIYIKQYNEGTISNKKENIFNSKENKYGMLDI